MTGLADQSEDQNRVCHSRRMHTSAMERAVKFGPRAAGASEIETIQDGRFNRQVVGRTAEEIGLTLTESERQFSERPRLVLCTQMEEFGAKPDRIGRIMVCLYRPVTTLGARSTI
jgi:hypothetical protein